jgi:dienelactone hydrolase
MEVQVGADPAAIAASVVAMARAERFTGIEELFAPPLRSVVSAETIQTAWTAEAARIGPVAAVGTPVSEPAGNGLVRVSTPVTGKRGGLTVVVSVDDAGKLNGFRLAPPTTRAWTPPRYASPGKFIEQEVMLGSGSLAVPGTLTLPRGRGRVFVLGHSGGGKAAPRVAGAEPSVAGLVILARDTLPLSGSAVRVARYLAELNGGEDMTAAVNAVTRQAEQVERAGLSPATQAADLLFGWSASYWLDLRDYDQVGVAAALDKPMLILQGRRDHQVTVDGDLARWQAGLAQQPDVTIRIYDADDHMFFAGAGKSTPADYERPQHVDPAVVACIADWLVPGRGRGPIARLFSGPQRRHRLCGGRLR